MEELNEKEENGQNEEEKQGLDMSENKFFEWYNSYSTTNAERELLNRISVFFEELFDDMLFRPGSSVHDFISENNNLVTGLPEQLEYFSATWFTVSIEDLEEGVAGQFDGENQHITIARECANADNVILHEMIHVAEFVVNSLPMFFHDALLWCLYRDLRNKIADLDDRILSHGHILKSRAIALEGGTHDILFLLKSFDLDLRMGYKLGTVFGYGMADE